MSEVAEPIDVTPAMIAAAWDAWLPRRPGWQRDHKPMKAGPAFVEAIRAALAASRFSQKETGDGEG